MKITLVLIASLTFAFGGIPKDRLGFLCSVYGICGTKAKAPTTKAPITMAPTTLAPKTLAPTTTAPTTASPDLAKIKVELVSYNKDGNFRSRSAGRAGRAMGNGSFERSCTPHEHTLWPFLIFALPALSRAKIALPPL